MLCGPLINDGCQPRSFSPSRLLWSGVGLLHNTVASNQSNNRSTQFTDREQQSVRVDTAWTLATHSLPSCAITFHLSTLSCQITQI